MKAKSTIEKQIRQLTAMVESETDPVKKQVAYEIWHALRWVIEDVQWTPIKLAKGSGLPEGER